MKYLNNMLSEVKGEKAHKEAVSMGLKYKGFGYWADPTTGQTKYKTENDTLVPVEAEVVADTYAGGNPRGVPGQENQEGGGMGMGGAGGQGMGAMGGAPQVNPGANIGSSNPGEELAPLEADAASWEPGPDGDTCVGPNANEEPGRVPEDSFVGKTNYHKWTAGPDGSNITNVDLANMKETFCLLPNVNLFEEEGEQPQADKVGAAMLAKDVRGSKKENEPSYLDLVRKDKRPTSFLHNVMRNQFNVPHPQVYDPKFNSVIADNIQGKQRSGYNTFMARMKGEQEPDSRVKRFQSGMRGLQDLEDKMDANRPGPMAQAPRPASQMFGRMRQAMQQGGDMTNLYFGKGQADLAAEVAQDPIDRLQFQADKDVKVTDMLNKAHNDAGLFKNPDFDLERTDEGRFLGRGAFGDVMAYQDPDDPDKEVAIKSGHIGPKEFQALNLLKDNPGFPDLINGKLNTPFANYRAVLNNPMALNNDQDMFPMMDMMGSQALGKFAMEVVPGEQLGEFGIDEEDGGDIGRNPELREKLQRKFWDLRGQMHKAGIAHNDMHLNNVMYDDESEEMHFVDMGLADTNPLAALMEGLGGMHHGEFSHPAFGDHQMNNPKRWESASAPDGGEYHGQPFKAMMGPNQGLLPDDMMKMMKENHGNVLNKMGERAKPELADLLDKVGEGGIRQGIGDLNNIATILNLLDEDEEGNMNIGERGEKEVYEYLDMLYDGLAFAPGEREGMETAKNRNKKEPPEFDPLNPNEGKKERADAKKQSSFNPLDPRGSKKAEKKSSNFKDIKKTMSPINAFSAPPESGFGRMKPLLNRDD